MLVALEYSQAIRKEVVIAGDADADLTRAFLRKRCAAISCRTQSPCSLTRMRRARKLAPIFPSAAQYAPHRRPTNRLRLRELRLPASDKRNL